MRRSLLLLQLFFLPVIVFSQQVPSPEENIPYMVTFGNESEKAWGDDDFQQGFFFMIPKSNKAPFFIRVFDPETGGKHDEINVNPNTETRFSIYGGKGALTGVKPSVDNPEGMLKTGTLLASKTFGYDSQYDGQWYTFGPFNPVTGEDMDTAYIFKVVAEGIKGNDGNLYRYFLSEKQNENSEVEGARFFTYEYTFRLPDKPSATHIYPYVNERVTSIKVHSFDFDNDGKINLITVAKTEGVNISGDNKWIVSQHPIIEEERNTSLHIFMVKNTFSKNNNVVFFITNQYGELLPFYPSPLGVVANPEIGAHKADHD